MLMKHLHLYTGSFSVTDMKILFSTSDIMDKALSSKNIFSFIALLTIPYTDIDDECLFLIINRNFVQCVQKI